MAGAPSPPTLRGVKVAGSPASPPVTHRSMPQGAGLADGADIVEAPAILVGSIFNNAHSNDEAREPVQTGASTSRRHGDRRRRRRRGSPPLQAEVRSSAARRLSSG